MGLIDRYRKFAELSDEEVREQFRQQAEESRARALEKVELIDLSTTTPEELPHPAIAAAISFAAKRALNKPSSAVTADLRDRLASLSSFDPARVAVGHGATGLISAISAALLGPERTLLTPWPSYPLYPAAAASVGAEAHPIGPWRGPEAMAGTVAEHPSAALLVICNPNDPDGRLIPANEIATLRDLLPDRITLLIDEALVDYAGQAHMDAMADLADSTPGIILVRSMSKAWGLAGLRIGWALGGPGSEELFSRIAPLLSVPAPSQAGAMSALDEAPTTPVVRSREIAKERERVQSLLRASTVELSDTHANFLWLRIPGITAEQLTASLRGSGISVFDGTELGCDEHVRATIRSDRAANDRLVEGLLGACAQALSPPD